MRALSDRRIWPTNRNVQIEMSRAMCCVSYRRVTVKVLLFLLFRAIVAIASVCCYRNHPHRARKSYTFGSLLIARPHRTHSFFFHSYGAACACDYVSRTCTTERARHLDGDYLHSQSFYVCASSLCATDCDWPSRQNVH